MIHNPETSIKFNKDFLKEIATLKMAEINVPLADSTAYKKFKLKIVSLTEQLLEETSKTPNNNYRNFEKSVHSAGVNNENAYLFIRGHDLYEMVVAICENISKSIKHAEIAKIKKRLPKPRDAIQAIHNEWHNYGASLKTGYFAANLKIEFFSSTSEKLQAQYG